MTRLAPTSAVLPVAGVSDVSRPARRAWFAALAQVWAGWWLLGFAALHTGYIVLGRGFAYLPYPPLFVGELTLAAGVPAVLLCRRWRWVFTTPTGFFIVALGLWCLAQTLPYLGTHGVDALRDAAVFYYAAFALIVAAVFVDQPDRLPRAIAWFDRWGWRLLIPIPFIFAAQMALGDGMPTWPGIGVPISDIKAGDPLVFTGAVAALTVVGLGRARSIAWFFPLAALVALHGTVSRGGLISFTLAFVIAFAAFPKNTWPWRFVAITLVLITALVAINPSIPIPGRSREFSVQQVAINVYSTFADTDAGDLEDTKSWRIEWWTQIVNYTVHGEHFWAGKGFGVNLADSDGFQVDLENKSLRSPHNGHLTLLARAGVPGFALWVALHASWSLAMLLAYLRCRARGQRGWQRYLVWLGAAYTATMFHASFDVYLENPMGGIWLWSIVGLGLAGLYLIPRRPTLLERFDTAGSIDDPSNLFHFPTRRGSRP